MPNAEFDLTEGQVTEFIQSLTHEARWRMLNQMIDHIEWDNYDRLEVEELDIERTEAGDKPGFVCPHCHDVFPTHRIRVIDYARSNARPHRVDLNKQLIYVRDHDADDLEFEHAVLLCPECEEPVGLPYRWDHEHE